MASVNPAAQPGFAAKAHRGAPIATTSGGIARSASPASPKAARGVAPIAVASKPAPSAAAAPAIAPKSTRGTASSAATPSPAPAPAMLLGDIDGDGRVGRADGRALLDYLFTGGAAPTNLAQADLNGDGSVNIADAMQMLAAENAASPPAPAPVPTSVASPFLLRQATAGYQRSAVPTTSLRP